ncbi:MAG: hypothetical protein V3S24_15310, partial [Candidatus Tectomicrobia bacterium]
MPFRSTWLPAVVVLFWLSPAYGDSTSWLQQVRFGHHGTFSRVVFDLREDTPYRLVAAEVLSKIVLVFPQLRQLPSQRVYRTRDSLIEAVRFVVTPTAIQAEIILKQPGRMQRLFHLEAPPRIVVDIAPDQEASAAKEPPLGQEEGTSPRQVDSPRLKLKWETELTLPEGGKAPSSEPVAVDAQQQRETHDRLELEETFSNRFASAGRE